MVAGTRFHTEVKFLPYGKKFSNPLFMDMNKGIYINYEDWVDHCLLTNKMLFDMGIERMDNTQSPKFLLMWYFYNDV